MQKASNSLVPGVFQVQQAPARSPIFYTVTTQNLFPLDYKQRNYVYFFSDSVFILTVPGYGVINVPAATWFPVLFPETTKLQINANEITVQCTDVPIQITTMEVPRLVADMLTLPKQTLTSYSVQLSGAAYSELAVDFTIYSITGGTAPTVTFLVSRVGLDGQLYKLEQAAALSAAGTISYSIGAGLDGKSFAGLFQVDMVTTGNPTGVQISGSIKAKQ